MKFMGARLLPVLTTSTVEASKLAGHLRPLLQLSLYYACDEVTLASILCELWGAQERKVTPKGIDRVPCLLNAASKCRPS